MESLYVCHFSNGHIKVGRSINPEARIADHIDRVACVGLELVEWHTAECNGPAASRESALIDRCIAAASARFKNEWFAGLDYPTVCAWATEDAATDHDHHETRWTRLIAELRCLGMTQAEIGAAISYSATSMSRLALGQQAEPLHSIGEKLIALHAQRIAQPA